MKNAFNNEVLNSFSDINRLIFKLAKSDAERNDLTVVQLKTLYKVSSFPNIGLVELAEHLKLTNSTVSGVIDRLVQSELIQRNVSPADRRAITIHLTEKGELKLKQIIKEESDLVQKLIEIKQKLSEEELNQLLEIHKKIAEILS
ncbi:MarR family winged helix-turn-helix transcriptional regulator [Bacillus sp. S/N-304-OC-R1]|uniref:MarR family winged helix-turn-helix transcriptional regulator n=1 Tax=Bacillus sp. S/N-304-OC-R1 TaxID=2758034 RepID=UPI001C8D61A8|nr:MarR family transcriptional regulator [Bacillus sp. S/N-304-OC-R1]MBY0123551.1 MarR family transcriptional regulator [Bacillus sp. S/N-304-OC-R1]